MSCVFNIDTFTKQEANSITNNLIFIEKVKSFRGKSKIPNTIMMIIREKYIDKDGKEQTLVYLPFHFIVKTYSKFFNDINNYPITNVQFTGNLRDYQYEVVEEMMQHIKTFSSTTLCLYPGFGKTILGAYLSSEVKLKTVVIMNNTILIDQWVTTFIDNTNAVIQIIDCDSGKTKKNQINFNADVFICMNQQIEKLSIIKSQIGLAIFDEAHSLCTPTTVNAWLYFSPKYILVETATPIRKDDLHKMFISVAGPHQIIRKRTTPFNVFRVDTGIRMLKEIINLKGQAETLTYQEAMSNLVDNIDRNTMIMMIINKMISWNHKVLVVGRRKKLCSNILEILESNIPNIKVDTLFGKKKEHEDGNVLIGTLSKMGKGYDQANFCKYFDGKKFTVLVIIDYIADEAPLEQLTGRLRCDNPIIIQIYDKYPSFTTVWKNNQIYYEMYKSMIVKTNYETFMK